MKMDRITENAKAILLLCGRFGLAEDSDAKPLTTKEYDELASWLQKKQWWPEDLLDQGRWTEMESDVPPVDLSRLRLLLGRGASMAFAIERWTNVGLWVVCRSDNMYPQRLKNMLKRSAPPILYGVGDLDLLSRGGVAVVGSRNVDQSGEAFAREVGRKVAECGMQVVSGAARGVDEFAMHGAFVAGGSVLGVVSDSLLRSAVSPKYREGIMEGRLTLISPFNPESPFSVGNAMGRNKYIYALAEMSVVVSADHKKGGTWAGAEEELKSKSGRPLYVRISPGVPKGNSELLKLGAKEFPPNGLTSNIRDLLLSVPAVQSPQVYAPEIDLFSQPRSPSVREPVEQPYSDTTNVGQKASDETNKVAKKEPEVEIISPTSALGLLTQQILSQLSTPKTLEELTNYFAVRELQMKYWLKQLKANGFVAEKKIQKKKKYVASLH